MQFLKCKIFICFFLFMAVFSCTGDEDIAGTYIITSFENNECSDLGENIYFDFSKNGGCSVIEGIEVCGNGTLLLTSTGEVTLNLTMSEDGDSETFIISGTYDLNKMTMDFCQSSTCQTVGFVLNNDMIAITFEDSSCNTVISASK